MSKWFILLLMLFFHVIDDYRLQGILASMKQKKWWQDNAPNTLYRHDYLMALAVHSFSWAFMIMLPITFWYGFETTNLFFAVLIINGIIHAIVDDLKANKLKINLITDQMIHFVQIVATFLLFM